jgi:hypothetical protein
MYFAPFVDNFNKNTLLMWFFSNFKLWLVLKECCIAHLTPAHNLKFGLRGFLFFKKKKTRPKTCFFFAET